MRRRTGHPGVDFVKIAPHISKKVRRRRPIGIIPGSVRINLNRRINGKSLGEYRVLSSLQIFYYGERQEPLVFKVPVVIGGRKLVVRTQYGVYLGDVPVIMCAKSVAEQFLCGGKLPDMKKITVRTVNGEEQKVVFMADIVKISAEKFVAEIKNVALCAVKSGFESGYEVILHPALLNLGNSEKKKEDNCAKVNENTADNKPLGTEERIEKDGNRGSTGEGADNKRKKGEEKRADEITDTCEKENILNERGGKAV